jgi:hypothetical protein
VELVLKFGKISVDFGDGFHVVGPYGHWWFSFGHKIHSQKCKLVAL